MRQGGWRVPHRSRPRLGSEARHRSRGSRRRRTAGARLGGADRRGDPGRAGAVRRGRLPGGDRRSADRGQREGQPSGRGGAEQGLRQVRRRRAPVEHRQARVQRHPARCRVVPGARPGHEPPIGSPAPRDRGLSAPGHRGAVPARPHAEVQEQAGTRPRRSADRAAHPDGPAGGTLRSRSRARPGRCGRRGLLGRAAAAGGDRHPQEPAAGRRGPGRRGGVRVRRALCGNAARRRHDVRRLRDRLHRHPHPPGGARSQPASAQGSGDRG